MKINTLVKFLPINLINQNEYPLFSVLENEKIEQIINWLTF